MAHAVLGTTSEGRVLYFFLHAFYCKTHLFSMLEDFSGYLGTTAKTNPSRKTRRAQEREVSFGTLKNTGSSREKHRACEVEPLEGGAESRPGEGCSAELSPCGPAGKPVRRYLNLPCSDSHQDQNKSCRWAASLLSGLGSGWCRTGCSAPPEQELMEEKIPDGETATGAGTPCPR